MLIEQSWPNLAVAIGIGLLIGAERERRKGTGADRSPEGIRTFTIASMLGAVSSIFNFWLLLASIICVTLFTVATRYHQKSEDPGITTEIALILTVILGGLSMRSPALSAAIAVAVAILLAAKEPMHGFVRRVVTKDELDDFLILSAATLIIFPLVPNEFIGPYDAVNLRDIWVLVILVIAINVLGQLVLRWLGTRIGLPVVGLVSGFVSSVATIAAMGSRAKVVHGLIGSAVAGATLSSIATVIQLAILLAAVYPPVLNVLAMPLVFGGASIAIYGLIVGFNSFQKNQIETTKMTNTFSVKSAFILAGMIGMVLIISAALKDQFGQVGLVIALGVAGFADVHAPTIAVASQAAAGKLALENAAIPILVAFSTNTMAKALVAIASGCKAFSTQIIIGLALQLVAVWLGWWLSWSVF